MRFTNELLHSERFKRMRLAAADQGCNAARRGLRVAGTFTIQEQLP
jgi:hypothetical protein